MTPLEEQPRCLHDQSDLSALLDGELPQAQVREVTDLILHCSSCARFYAEARRLEGLLALSGQIESEEPSEDLWPRIAAASEAADVEVTNVTSGPWMQPRRWALLAAAVVALVFSMVLLGDRLGRGPSLLDSTITNLQEEGDGPAMTDDRFVEIASELLQSDSRYLDEMRALMIQLETDRYAEKTTTESRRTSEGNFPVSDGFDSLESGTQNVSVQLW